MVNEKSVDVLNTLIQINSDRIEGYETAFNETDEGDLKTLFSQFIQTSEECKAELMDEVHKLGGKPAEGTKTSGKFFRVWMDVKAALTGRDRTAILSSCEYGEDVACNTYEKALKKSPSNITADQRIMLHIQHGQLKDDRDKIKGLIDMLVSTV